MKRSRLLYVIFSILILCGPLKAAERPVDLVYPLLDTYNSRWFFFSSAARPFGMVSLSPDTKVNGAWSSGYVYTTKNIKGFSHIHAWQMSGLSVMPVSFAGGQEKGLFVDCSSDFSHSDETVEVGYHSVHLDRYDIRAELTGTVRTGFHRYTFAKAGEKHGILFNLNGELGPCNTYDGELVLVDEHTVEGHFKDAPTFRRPKPVSFHFRAELDAPVKEVVRDPETGNCLLVLAPGCDKVMMKVGISYTSVENAGLNLRQENPGWDFDAVVRDSKEEWNSLLSRIEIEGGTPDSRRRFYTDLWHSLIGKHIINDVDGAYPDNMGPEYRTGHLPLDGEGKPLFNHFNTDGLWGVQWNLSILWGLVYPDIYRQMICSQMQYCSDGGLIPRGPSGGNYTYVMTSSSSTPFFVSAIQKGIVTDGVEEMYQALKKNHMPGGIMERGRYEHGSALGGGLKYYLENGYVPYPIPDERVGHTDGAGLTLEYAYQDWCLAQLALKLGHRDDYKYFTGRSKNYRKVFDASSGWMRPKDIDGNWLEPFDPFETGCGFIEANAAQDTWYVPHDAKGLAKLLGGRKKAAEKLSRCFEEASKLDFTSGTSHEAENNPEFRRIPINYGNEPSIQTAFMFSLFDRQDLTEHWSRQVVDKVFTRLAPDAGYNGDEDQGMMGGLSVMMKLGLFQVNGGTDRDPVYQTGSPVFDRAVIHLDKDFYPGDSITISAENASSGRAEVKKLYLNGRPLKPGRLRHSDLVGGADLRFVFAEPEKGSPVKKAPEGEPYPGISAIDSGKPVDQSPDPLVSCRWAEPKADDGLEVYALDPVAVEAEGCEVISDTEVWADGPCDIRMDFGQVNAAWLEFECDELADPGSGASVECSISEFNEPAVFNSGSQHPVKTLAPVQYGNTFRLELNDELYEGVRYAWIHVKDAGASVLKFKNIRLVCQAKPANYEGSFDSDSDLLDRIWYTGAYTVRLNFLQEYFGAILMERSDRFSWTGDAHTSQAASLVAFGNYDFVRKNLIHTAPQSNGIKSYSLYWVQSLVDYYNYTADAEFLDNYTENACGKLEEALATFENPRSLGFYGWDERLGSGGENPDRAEPALAYRMLCIQTWRRFAQAMAQRGREDLSERYNGYADESASKLLSSPGWDSGMDVFSASDAVNAGVIPESRYDELWEKVYSDRLQRVSYSPFNEYFILNALARQGRYAEAMNTIDDCWGGQIRYGATTFFEVFRPSWTLSKKAVNDAPVNNQCGYTSFTHPWSAGVTKWLSEEVLGIKPLEPGFAKFLVCPHLAAGLTRVSGTMPTPHGIISFSIDTKAGNASLTVPVGTSAKVVLPTGEVSEPGPGEHTFSFCYEPVSAVPENPIAYTFDNFTEDSQTGGDWTGRYGSRGYILFSYDGPGANRTKLPAGCKDFVFGKDRYTEFSLDPADRRALVSDRAGEDGRRLGAMITGDPTPCLQTMTVDVDYRTDGEYKLSLYFVDPDDGARRSAIEVFDLETRRLLAPVHFVRDYAQGRYVSFTVDRPVRIRIDQVRGVNAACSALFID